MEGTEGTATGAAATTAPDPASPVTQTTTPATPTPTQEAIKTQTPVKAAYHGPLCEDVVYIATAADAQHGIAEGQALAGKVVKVVKEDDENHLLVCNLLLFAADSSATLFKPDVELGKGEGKFLLS